MHNRFVVIITACSFVVYTMAVAAGAEKAAPVAAPAKNAQITVLTGGEICTVYIDGTLVGESPRTFPVAAGKHTVRAVPPTGRSKEKTIKIGENETEVIRFGFPMPKPVEDAVRGRVRSDEEPWLTNVDIAFGVVLLVMIGAAIVVANTHGSHHVSTSIVVNNGSIGLSFRSSTSDGDRVAVYVNGTKVNEFTVTAGGTGISVVLSPGHNVITIQALNEGATPGNTGTVTVSNVISGSNTLQWSLFANTSCSFEIDVQ